jgi:hypothetical protein
MTGSVTSISSLGSSAGASFGGSIGVTRPLDPLLKSMSSYSCGKHARSVIFSPVSAMRALYREIIETKFRAGDRIMQTPESVEGR